MANSVIEVEIKLIGIVTKYLFKSVKVKISLSKIC